MYCSDYIAIDGHYILLRKLATTRAFLNSFGARLDFIKIGSCASRIFFKEQRIEIMENNRLETC